MPTGKLFILGTGRCGTHSLANILGTVPQTLALHEGSTKTGAFNPDLGPMRGLNCHIYRDPHKARARIRATEENRGLMRLRLAWLARSRVRLIQRLEREGTHFCESNPYIYHLTRHLHARFPEAFFVHLVRDGYATTRSYLSRDKTTYPDRLERKRRTGWWCAKPFPPTDDEHFATWGGMNRLEKTAWFWQYVNDYIQECLQSLPSERTMTLRIEDLCEDRVEELLNLAGLPSDFDRKSLQRRVSTSKRSKSEGWTETQMAAFERIAGPTMRRFGYALLD